MENHKNFTVFLGKSVKGTENLVFYDKCSDS